MNDLKSMHQHQVEQFMRLAKQGLPGRPTVPSAEVRLLRARLILEEALETISDGLGVNVLIRDVVIGPNELVSERLHFYVAGDDFNMIELIDGCCDLAVVTTGTLSACGVPDIPFQDEVNQNNLAKFGPGHSWRDDGKLIKPPDHEPPRIVEVLEVITETYSDG